ncbi:MAG TPA: carboxypeptidase-like regulatory domain-containing protein [Bacteroidota bacterium]|nr:carboxypeptidase-like regulatory domain-containing protein [Bacteroidota bacterium]
MSRLLWIALILMLIPALLVAGPGKISGKITDKDSKEALIGASVSIDGTTLGAVTDVNGHYVILNVQTGTYTLKAAYVGYQTITISNIRVNEDLMTIQDFNLPATGVTVPTVEIVAQRPLVNKTATNSVRIIDNEFFANLPTRGVDAAIQLQPGVVQQGNSVYIRGGRADETGYQLEGVAINNMLFGGRSVSFSDAAIEQIQVQTGYGAEFGGSTSGLVSSQLRTGNADNWKAMLQLETDNYTGMGKESLGGYSYGYSDYTGTLNGPISGKTLRFFGSFENTFYRSASIDPTSGTPTPEVWDGYNFTGANALISSTPAISYRHPTTQAVDTLNVLAVPGDRAAGGSNQYQYSGTLLFDQSPLQIRLAGSYSTQTARDPVDITNILNSMRTAEHVLRNSSLSMKGSYLFDPKNYFEVNLTYGYNYNVTRDPLMGDNFDAYGDSAANAKLGYQMLNESVFIPAYAIFDGNAGIALNQPGTEISGYNLIVQSNIGGRADFTSQLTSTNQLKVGGEFTRGTVSRFSPPSVASRALILRETSPGLERSVLLRGTYGIDNYGYDEYGNSISNDVMVGPNITDFGPRHPLSAAGYVEDRFEFSDVIVSAGLRYDHINPDSWEFIDPNNLVFVDSLKTVATSSLTKTASTDQVSPRLGFSFPVTDRTVFHAQYGKYIQQSELRDSYLGMGSLYHEISGGNFVTQTVGYGLKPERTTNYEMGFQQQMSDATAFDVTAYYDDKLDQVQYTEVLPAGGSTQKAYPAYINGDFSTTEGVEFKFTLRRTNRIQASVDYTFSNAATTGSNPSELAGAVVASGGGPYIPTYISPADFDETHRGNFSIDYRFGKDDGGALERSGVNLLAQFNSGHPYTLLNIPSLNTGDPRFRTPEGVINSWTTPWYFELDGRIDKAFPLGNFNADVYIYAQNILNTQNAINVYSRTGDPANDGWLSTPAGIAAVQAEGQQYANFYNAINNGANSGNYGIPRQLRFGIRLDY